MIVIPLWLVHLHVMIIWYCKLFYAGGGHVPTQGCALTRPFAFWGSLPYFLPAAAVSGRFVSRKSRTADVFAV